VNGGFSWLDERDRYVLDLTSPLGLTQARVEARSGMAILTRANGEQVRASDPDSLAAEVLGNRIPVAGLRDWFQGRDAARAPASGITHHIPDRPQVFKQGGWQATLSRYDGMGPRSLVLERHEPGRHIVLRLVVDSV
jgi:outer membrane lipoprotein LolB